MITVRSNGGYILGWYDADTTSWRFPEGNLIVINKNRGNTSLWDEFLPDDYADWLPE
jgi:hypothetical protein